MDKLETMPVEAMGLASRQRRRSRVDIYREVLLALRRESEQRRPSLTRVANTVNMPYDRLIVLLGYLADVGLCVRVGRGFEVTPIGRGFLEECDRFSKAIDKIGLEL